MATIFSSSHRAKNLIILRRELRKDVRKISHLMQLVHQREINGIMRSPIDAGANSALDGLSSVGGIPLWTQCLSIGRQQSPVEYLFSTQHRAHERQVFYHNMCRFLKAKTCQDVTLCARYMHAVWSPDDKLTLGLRTHLAIAGMAKMLFDKFLFSKHCIPHLRQLK